MQPEVYENRRGETVMPLRVFKHLANSDKALRYILKTPYPKKNRSIKKRAANRK